PTDRGELLRQLRVGSDDLRASRRGHRLVSKADHPGVLRGQHPLVCAAKLAFGDLRRLPDAAFQTPSHRRSSARLPWLRQPRRPGAADLPPRGALHLPRLCAHSSSRGAVHLRPSTGARRLAASKRGVSALRADVVADAGAGGARRRRSPPLAFRPGLLARCGSSSCSLHPCGPGRLSRWPRLLASWFGAATSSRWQWTRCAREIWRPGFERWGLRFTTSLDCRPRAFRCAWRSTFIDSRRLPAASSSSTPISRTTIFCRSLRPAAPERVPASCDPFTRNARSTTDCCKEKSIAGRMD